MVSLLTHICLNELSAANACSRLGCLSVPLYITKAEYLLRGIFIFSRMDKYGLHKIPHRFLNLISFSRVTTITLAERVIIMNLLPPFFYSIKRKQNNAIFDKHLMVWQCLIICWFSRGRKRRLIKSYRCLVASMLIRNTPQCWWVGPETNRRRHWKEIACEL